MRTGIMNHQKISHVDLRQHPVNRKLIAVLAKGACHIILVVARRILLAHHRNMVICPVDCRAHQVHGTRVHTDVLLVGMLLMDGRCHQAAVRSQHKTSHLRVDCDIAKSRRN